MFIYNAGNEYLEFKNMKHTLLAVVLSLLVVQLYAAEPYLNTQLSFESRTADLLSKLTLEEKISLMSYQSPAIPRLGIKAYNWWNECLHGVARSGEATVFPEAIGMAAMWDTQQMYKIANAISDEARAKYNDYQRQGKYGIYQGLTFWTPNINIFRDPRWGRGMETYGEDPFLTAELAIPFIHGLQGNNEKYFKLIATVKHFAVHSGPESKRHSFDVWPSDYDLSETYLPHFKRTVEEAGVYSVMCAYQRLKGAPCCGSEFLNQLLRNEWNFQGYVVSDCGAIHDFYEKTAHHVVATPEEASAAALHAGTDLNCGSVYANSLLGAVNQGLITEGDIDRSVTRLLLARMRLGEFDPADSVPFSTIPLSVLENKEHQALALETARKSMVLLENKNQTLPFSKSVKKVAVIGPNANNEEILLGNYNGFSKYQVTPFQGIAEKLPNALVQYAPGCRLAAELPDLIPVSREYLFTDKSLRMHGLKASYFDNKNFSGKAKISKIDDDIDFKWWSDSPLEGINASEFSVRWTGVLVPPVTGKYAIGGEGFSGFEVYLDGKLVVKCPPNVDEPHKNYEFLELKAHQKYQIQFNYIQDHTEYAVTRFTWDVPDENMQAKAIDLARNSDVVVLCMGLSPMLEGEEMKVRVKGFSGGDREDIQLPEVQTELIHEIQKLGKPTVLVLLNGSALAFNWEAENIPAILEAWYPGEAGGKAIADILFGDYNPAGRLPLTFYKDIQQIPPFEAYDMKGKTYRYFDGKPLYEFGYGLSYTDFQYKLLSAPQQITAGDSVNISVEITNTGKLAGEEVAQLYVSLPDSKLQKPIRSLEGFQRVFLQPGESKKLDFRLKASQMTARDAENRAVVEAGKVVISVGSKQPDEQSVGNKKVVQTNVTVQGNTYYTNE